MAEIIIVTRYVELRSQLHRMISVLKVRDSQINSALHKFTITPTGIVIEGDESGAEAILAQTHLGGDRTSFTTIWIPGVAARNNVALILVVDDEYSIAELLEAALTDAGHEVVTAVDGRQGLGARCGSGGRILYCLIL